MREASGEGEVVAVLMGPAKAADSVRKALADRRRPSRPRRGRRARRAPISWRRPGPREGARARGGRPRPRSASRGATPTAPSCGRRSPRRCRLPVISQAASLESADGKAKAKRQTEYGYDVIEAPLPCIVGRLGRDQRAALPVAQGDHGREEEAAGDALASRTSASARTTWATRARAPRSYALADPPPRGESRADRGRRRRRRPSRSSSTSRSRS